MHFTINIIHFFTDIKYILIINIYVTLIVKIKKKHFKILN